VKKDKKLKQVTLKRYLSSCWYCYCSKRW